MKIVIGVGGAVILLSACFALKAAPVEKYREIPKRNVFGLKDIKTPEVVPTNNPPASPKLFLTGITTILGNKLAMMQVQFPPAQGQQPHEQSVMLAEGQREGGIEVRRIDEVGKTVEVDNFGTVMPLTFEKNGLKQAPPGPTPSTPPVGPGASNPPAAPTAAVTNEMMPPTLPSPRVVGRTLRLPNMVAPAQTVVTPTPPPSPAALGAHANTARDQANGVATQLTPEEERLLRELEQRTGQTQSPQ